MDEWLTSTRCSVAVAHLQVHEVMQTAIMHMSHQWPEVHRYSMCKLQTCSNQPSEEEPTVELMDSDDGDGD